MRCRLDIPYADTRAAQLSWRLDDVLRPALATLEVAVPGGLLEFRLLGASHQVVAHLEDATCSETVACDGMHGNLPPATGMDLPGLSYRFSSAVERLTLTCLAGRAEAILHRVGDDPRGIVGVFPGAGHAITAIAAGPGVGWRTWHVYPQANEVVATTTTLVLR